MSEVNETNDMLTEIKEQLIIATHETGEMPNIMKSKKKADSNRGYFYDAQNNTLYLKDEQTWNSIKGNLSADLSSDDMGINVSIQPLQGIDGYQGESIEDLQDKVDKVNRENHHEYYRLIKRGKYDCLLCYSFNNVADRDRFAAEMDDAFGVGNGDVSDDAKYDKYDDEEIDEDFSDEEVLDAPSHRKQNDNRKQKDTQKEKAKVNKKKQKDDEKKKNDDDKEKKKDDGNTKDNEEGEQEVTLVEELGDTLVNQTGGTQVNDNSVSGNAGGSGKTEQAIEARFAAVNAQQLPNRYAYLEQYCRIAKEFGEPDGYSLSKNMDKRKAFEVRDVDGRSHHCKEKKLQEMSRENLLMHMLSDILPAIAGGEVVHYRNNEKNELYIKNPDVQVNFDSILNHERVRNSVFVGYFRDLINRLKPLASQKTFCRRLAAGFIINCVVNDIGLMREFLTGKTWGQWKNGKGKAFELGEYLENDNSRHGLGEVILPFDWMRGEDFSPKWNAAGHRVWRLTPRTVGFKAQGQNNYLNYRELEQLDMTQVGRAAMIALDCGDMYPSGDLKRDLYYLCWARVADPTAQGDVAREDQGVSFKTYYSAGGVSKGVHKAAIKQERIRCRDRRDFAASYFVPSLKDANLKKLLTEAEVAELEGSREVFEDVGSRFTPPIIRNYNKLQNLNSSNGYSGPHYQA